MIELVVKLASAAGAQALQEAVVNVVRRVSSDKVGAGDVSVSKVFPGQVTGNRARMYAVGLPESLSPESVDAVVDALRAEAPIEYAQRPAPKHPAG